MTPTTTYRNLAATGQTVTTDPCTPCPACGGLECLCRPRFFAGQLLTEADLNRLDHYIVAKNKLHNRYVHGWGVACGMEVVCSVCGDQVVVRAGYASESLRRRHRPVRRPDRRYLRPDYRMLPAAARRLLSPSPAARLSAKKQSSSGSSPFATTRRSPAACPLFEPRTHARRNAGVDHRMAVAAAPANPPRLLSVPRRRSASPSPSASHSSSLPTRRRRNRANSRVGPCSIAFSPVSPSSRQPFPLRPPAPT